MSWEQILDLLFTPGLIGGFAGSFLVLAAGHFVPAGFPKQPSEWSWGEKVLFVSAGTLLGLLWSLQAAVGDTGTLNLGNLQKDWSRLLYYTMAGAGWFYIALGFMGAAKALAKARTIGKEVVKATAQALLEEKKKDKVGGLGHA